MTDADRGDGRADVCHRVVDGETGGHGAAGRIDIERDGLFRIVGFKEEELRDDAGGDGLIDGAVEAYYSLFQKAREDVVCVPTTSLRSQHIHCDDRDSRRTTVSVTNGVGVHPRGTLLDGLLGGVAPGKLENGLR